MISKKKKQAKKIKKAKLKKNLADVRGDKKMAAYFSDKLKRLELKTNPGAAFTPQQIRDERNNGVFRTAAGGIKV